MDPSTVNNDRISLCMIMLVAMTGSLCGCTSTAPPKADDIAAPGHTTSFDGRYEGVVRVASSASGTDVAACETDSRVV
ncbi:MAG TPA: hypothetical protein VHO91_22470, partial [Rhodopila sp.]|nr:hypothetical protein [Rhodopila sp.]